MRVTISLHFSNMMRVTTALSFQLPIGNEKTCTQPARMSQGRRESAAEAAERCAWPRFRSLPICLFITTGLTEHCISIMCGLPFNWNNLRSTGFIAFTPGAGHAFQALRGMKLCEGLQNIV